MMFQKLWNRPSFALLIVAASGLCLTPVAHANDYLFSFTTSNVLSALSTTTDYAFDGYFAVFLQLQNPKATGQVGNPVINENPDPTGADAWTDSPVFYDPSAFNGDGDAFMYFGKQGNQNDVTLMSANSSFNYIPAGCTTATTTNCFQFKDTGTFPVGFGDLTANGGNGGDITDLLSNSATWQFEIAGNLSCNPCTFTGYASAIDSKNGFGSKGDIQDIAFTLTLSPTTIGSLAPEPGTWAFMAAGIALILAASARKRRMDRSGSSSVAR